MSKEHEHSKYEWDHLEDWLTQGGTCSKRR